MRIISPGTGVSFLLKKDQKLRVIDIEGQQVSDMCCIVAGDKNEFYSSSRTLENNESLQLSKGNRLYSNRGRVLLEIIHDVCGTHDLLMPPCREKMYQDLGDSQKIEHLSCHANLSKQLGGFGVSPDHIDSSFNIFMNVKISSGGKLSIEPSVSQKDDCIIFLAKEDLLVALTACSHEATRGGILKSVGYEIM